MTPESSPLTPRERGAIEGISDYRPRPLLFNRHLQTIYPKFRPTWRRPKYVRETWTTPDDDFIDVDIAAEGTPMLLVFHGLEGDSRSHYAQALCLAAMARGWGAAVVHFRGCSGRPNHLARAYHSGDSDEVQWMLETARRRWPDAQRLAVGISLGANVLLKWLGERGDSAAPLLAAAAAISAPHDLETSARSLAIGFNRVYTRVFMRTLRRKSLDKLTRFPGVFDRRQVLRARSFFDFDDAVTAPLHGFLGAHDYWSRCSCRPHLAAITLPTLIVNARNDPFLPEHALPVADAVGPGVHLATPAGGGHVGFFDGRRGKSGCDRFAEAVLRWLANASTPGG
ncbi:MAG: alpha/beta fold hydrolase [Burkholderiaceae bacterium]